MEDLKGQFELEKLKILDDKRQLLEECSLLKKENLDLKKILDLQKLYNEYELFTPFMKIRIN